MASLREIRRHIRGVRSVAQVTRAMQMVAATKMQRAQTQVLATRPYARHAWEVLQHLATQNGAAESLHPLLEARSRIETVGLVLVTSDKGLCGPYNANIIRTAAQFIEDIGVPVKIIAVGRRGAAYAARAGRDLLKAEFSDLPSRPRLLDITPIARASIDAFLSGELDEVYLGYTDFVSTLVQRPRIRRLLPLTAGPGYRSVVRSSVVQEEEPEAPAGEYIYEPNSQTILDIVLPRFTEIQIYQAILESLASEHSARMVAMRAATDNANELLRDLALTYNRARQDAITREMLDIAGGVEAMRG
ncbi:MAG: ATP synthase F1 subunit gamma [Anaerolineae bacterium]|nr:ATP synthase F1 subunit gamma [Anaerolineae bacterium]